MIKKILKNEIHKAIEVLCAHTLSEMSFSLERPTLNRFGDFSTNAALVLSKDKELTKALQDPHSFAEALTTTLRESSEFRSLVSDVKIEGPGFVNFTLSKKAIEYALTDTIEHLDAGYEFLFGEFVNVEFASVNPTGQAHFGHGRSAFFGDVLARVMDYAGASVVREFYINDSIGSGQIVELGKTALGTGEQYKTKWLLERAEECDLKDKDEKEAGYSLAQKIQAHNRAFLEDSLDVNFDVWFSEETEIREKRVEEEMKERLQKSGYVYEKEGALWLKTSEFGDDEDRVLVRNDGRGTYFLSDIAYHENKLSRGFSRAIDVWGADHHGHVKRLHAAGKMLGWPEDFLKIFVAQFVTLKKGDTLERMSKRKGNALYFEDLVRELGADVVRWFFLEKALSTHIEFNIDLARETSEKNPVYYIQYAHARMSSIVKNSAHRIPHKEQSFLDLLDEKNTRSLVVKLIEFPEIIETVSRDFALHKLATYAYELSSEFSQFYRDVRVVEDEGYNAAALEVVVSTKNVLAQTLTLLGIRAPEKM